MKRTKSNKKIFYDKRSDALWILVKSGEEAEYKEVSPGISVELGESGELLGIEILDASKTLGQFFMQTGENQNSKQFLVKDKSNTPFYKRSK